MTIAQLLVAPGFSKAMSGIIAASGLLSSLQLALDAGDSLSYPGSGLKWLDTSGGGFNFFKGTDGTTDAPTFNGAAGGLDASNFWSFVPPQFFTYQTGNESWMQLQALGAKFTLVFVEKPAAASGQRRGLCGTRSESIDEAGWWLDINSGNQLEFLQEGIAGTGVTSWITDGTVSSGSWHFMAVSIDTSVGVGGGFFYVDGAYKQVSSANTFTATYTVPGATAGETMQIAALGGGSRQLVTNDQLAICAIWGGLALSKSQLDSLYAALKTARPAFSLP